MTKETGFAVVDDDERKQQRAVARNPIWDEIAVEVRKGKTIRVTGYTRQAIMAAMRDRQLKVTTTQRPDKAIVIWEKVVEA